MLKSIQYQVTALIWCVVILVLCNMPMQGVSKSVGFFEGFDKIVHLGLFFVLTLFVFHGRIREHKSYKYQISTLLKIVLSTFLFGVLIELLQWKIFTYRSAEWWDLFADMLGVFMAIFSYILMHEKQDFFLLNQISNYEKPK